MDKLLVIVPSRGRPNVFHDFCKSFFDTASNADLLIGLDDDDGQYDIPDYDGRIIVDTNPRLKLGGTLNLLANKYADKYRYLGFMGDDHRPRTPGWDERYVENLQSPHSFVYGDDLIWGKKLPTQIAMTSDIVTTLGYMVPPGMIHMYLDNFWLELGKSLNSITYLDDVIIEHLHPSVGKGTWTPEYEATNNEEVFTHDRILFEKILCRTVAAGCGKVLLKILITGDAGFVGRHFHKKYEDHDITGVDIVNGTDARDFFKSSTERFDLVIHLAAVVGGRLTIEGNPMSVAVDLSIDAEMWNWALRTKPGRVVYFSSSAAYPNRLQEKGMTHRLTESDIDLNDIRSPDLTYGWSKLTGEYQAQFVEAEGIRTHIFRPFSGYGCDQGLDYPFPSFIQRGKLKENPFQIWGDGTQARDFIHISDIVDAVDQAIRQDVIGPVNLGWGRATDFNELAEIVIKTAEYTPRIQHLTARPSGVYHRVCDPSKMLSFYKPKIDLEQGVRLALNGAA